MRGWILSGVALASSLFGCSAGADTEPADAEEPTSTEMGVSVVSTPVQDTTEMIKPSGVYDFGAACELRVQSGGAPVYPYIDFPVDLEKVCPTLSRATLWLRSDFVLTTGPIDAWLASSAWTAGASGAAACGACDVALGYPAAFGAPGALPTPVATGTVTSGCAWSSWDVTALVQQWCNSTPVGEYGFVLGSAGGQASFHSMEAPAALRPRLEIAY